MKITLNLADRCETDVTITLHMRQYKNEIKATAIVGGYSIGLPSWHSEKQAILTLAYFLSYAWDAGYLQWFPRVEIDGLKISTLEANFFGHLLKLEGATETFLNKLKYAVENPRRAKKPQLL